MGRAAEPARLTAFPGALATSAWLTDVRNDIANSPEAQSDVANLLQRGYGFDASTFQIAAGQTQLASGLSLSDLQIQILPLAALPTSISGRGGTIQATTSADIFEFDPGTLGRDTIEGFSARQDLLQLSRTDLPMTAGQSDTTSVEGGALISLDPSDTIFLDGISSTSILPAHLRLV